MLKIGILPVLRLLGITMLVAVISVTLFHFRHDIFFSPWMSEVPLAYPQYAAKDAAGNYYVIDSSQRRVLKIGADGRLIYALKGGSRRQGTFFYAAEVTADAEGRLYLLNRVLDKYGMFLQREEILHYTPDGQLIGTRYARDYSDNKQSTLIQRGEVQALRADGGYVYWLQVDATGVMAYRSDSSPEEIARLDALQPNIIIADLDWWGDNGIVYTTKTGLIVRRSWDGRYEILFDGNIDKSGAGRIVPWEMVTGEGDAVYCLDLWQSRVISLSDKKPVSLFTHDDADRQGYPGTSGMYYRLNRAADGDLLIIDEDRIIHVDRDGQVREVVTSAGLLPRDQWLRTSGWLGSALLLILTGILLRRLYVDVMQRRVSLLFKQFLIVVPLVVISIFAISHVIIQDFLRLQGQESLYKVSSLAQTIARQVDGDLIHEVKTQADYMGSAYRTLRAELHAALNHNHDPWNEGYYFALYRVIDDKLYGFMYLNDKIGMFHPFIWFEEESSVYRLAYAGEIASEQVTDETGDWLYAVAPIYDDAGQVTALLEVGTDQYSLLQSHRDLYFKALRLMGAMTLPLALLLTLMTYAMLRSLRRLRDAVNRIAQGEWDARVETASRDEVADLGRCFNRMSTYIADYMCQIEQLNRSYRRFVPEQFIRYLDRPSVVDVRLGDQVQKEMSVLFSDIRSFTSISERMTPKENFDFLNTYLGLVGPCIRKHDGFIDKYIGDAIMALFPHDADDAVRAAVAMIRGLLRFNREREAAGQFPLKIGLGIHTGLLMLGIIGEEERMEGTVIADSVNLASRLEYLTKHYGATIIISETTLHHMHTPTQYRKRYLGKVNVIGKQNAMAIYEILDGEPQDLREHKLRTQMHFEQGLHAYEAGRIEEAEALFAEALAIWPDDKAVKLYQQACANLLAEGTAGAWNGAIKFDSK